MRRPLIRPRRIAAAAGPGGLAAGRDGVRRGLFAFVQRHRQRRRRSREDPRRRSRERAAGRAGRRRRDRFHDRVLDQGERGRQHRPRRGLRREHRMDQRQHRRRPRPLQPGPQVRRVDRRRRRRVRRVRQRHRRSDDLRHASVLDNQWHHVAVQRRRSDGFLSLYVDGTLQASADGPDGDVSYPDNGVPGNFCGGPCTNSDPFLVLGAEKHDAGAAFPSYEGLLRRAADLQRRSLCGELHAAACAVPRRRRDGRALPLRRRRRRDRERHQRHRRRSRARRHPALDAVRSRRSGRPTRRSMSARSASTRRSAARRSRAASQNPVDIVAAPGDTTRLFIVEQAGRIRIIRDGTRRDDAVPRRHVEDDRRRRAGPARPRVPSELRDESPALRLLHAQQRRCADHRALRAQRRPSGAGRRRERARAARDSAFGCPNHNGGKLAFRSDGYLYIGTGDGGGGNDPWFPDGNGQNFGTRLGKMLRVDVNIETPPYYAIPPTNPFAGMTCNGAGTGTCPEIWALGLRNPFRFSLRSAHRRPVHRRRRPGRARGSRLRAVRERQPGATTAGRSAKA